MLGSRERECATEQGSTSRAPAQLTLGLSHGAVREQLGPSAHVLRGFALPHVPALLSGVEEVVRQAPFRHMLTPAGKRMSAALTSCGRVGWVTDRAGYRYKARDPSSGLPWPPMPAPFATLAREAAHAGAFPAFEPDACLINRYLPGTGMALHQDKDERDLGAPIVSVSLGVACTFLFGGLSRSAPTRRTVLEHGDVVVWGADSRLCFHGVERLPREAHPELGSQRINLTFRRAR